MHTRAVNKSFSLDHALIAFAGLLLVGNASAASSTTHLFDSSIDGSRSLQPMYFPLTRTGDPSYDVVATYHTDDGTAVAGVDYVEANGTVVIPAGAPGNFLPVTILPVTNGPSVDFALRIDSVAGVAVNPTFSVAEEFSSGTSPYAVVAGDLNGDGRADVVVGNSDDATVSVLLNTTIPGAAPSFAAQQTFATGIGPYSVALADLNNDGRLDIITVNQVSNSVSVLINDTSAGASVPSFASEQTLDVTTLAFAIATGDFNNDGRLDLALTDGPNVTILLNTTVPGAEVVTFSSPASFATADYGSSIACADFNGDGLDDLAIASIGSSVSILLNNTSPGATAPSFSPYTALAGGESAERIVAADLNGDGKPDLAVADGDGGTVSVLTNTTLPGDDTASFAPTAAFATELAVYAVVVADTNGDGKPDIVVSGEKSSGSLTILRNSTAPGALPSFTAPVHFPTASTLPVALTFADFNGDGKLDVATTNLGAHSISVLENLTAPPTAQVNFNQPHFNATGSYPFFAAIADLNGDGRRDIVTVNTNANSLSVLLNSTVLGTNAIAFATRQDFSVGASPYELVAVDFNGDGRPDLATVNSGDGTVSILTNTTIPGSPEMSFALHPFPVGVAPFSITAADVNGDGLTDLIVTDPGTEQVFVALNETVPGSDVPALGVPHGFSTGPNPYAITTIDINGDGAPDLVVVEADSNTVSVLINTTLPGSTTPTFLARQSFSAGISPKSVLAADLNGDARPDLAIADYNGAVSVLVNATFPGSTTVSFLDAVATEVGGSPVWLSAVDFDGDGKQDILVADAASGTVAVLQNYTPPGSTTINLGRIVALASGQDTTWVAASDLDGDGRPELISTNAQDDSVAIFSNDQYRTILEHNPAIGTIVHDLIFANGFD